MLQTVFHLALQQQHCTDTALYGTIQGTTKGAPGQKISIGNNDFALRAGNRLQIARSISRRWLHRRSKK
jgi:hypothetical protein